MGKEYLRDGGRVRLCASNIAKMNLLESMYYHRSRMLENIIEFGNELKDNAYLIQEAFILIILPVAYPVMAWWEITKARKLVESEKRH